jgi:hypothetical protein
MNSFSDLVDTVTREFLVGRAVDTVLRENVFAGEILAKPEEFSGAVQKFPIIYGTGVSGTSFAGFDILPTSASNTRVNMVYNPKFFAINVALPGDAISANRTASQVLNLTELEMKERAQRMADQVGTMFQLDGFGNSSKDMNGLQAIVDNGSQVPIIGGLSRITYPTLDSTVTDAGGVLTQLKMRTMLNAIEDGNVIVSNIIAARSVKALYEQLLLPTIRANYNMEYKSRVNELHGSSGMRTLDYSGIPVVADRKIDQNNPNTMYFLNMDYLNFYGLDYWEGERITLKTKDIVGNSYNEFSVPGFVWGGWVKPYNAAAVNGFVYLGGDVITDNPRRHGRLFNVTSVN